MTTRTHGIRFISPHARPAIVILGMSLIAGLAICVAGVAGGLRINTTPSEPLGLWRIAPLDRRVEVGDMVFVCPPQTDVVSEGFDRGYLRLGMCHGGFGPLIKTVAAVAGQSIDVADNITVDGRPVASSDLVARDGHGRPMRPYAGGTVPAGFLFLHSPFPGSWDSRYFGPVPVWGVLGFAKQVLTYAP